jgi:hypothetical protein
MMEAFVIDASLDLVVTSAEPAEVVLDVAGERVEDTTAEVGEMLEEAVPASTVK